MREATLKKKKSQVMTVSEVAEYLRLSQAKVYRLARAGELPAMRVGKSWRFRKDLIDEWFLRGVKTGLELGDK